jgi:hypothetical protein
MAAFPHDPDTTPPPFAIKKLNLVGPYLFVAAPKNFRRTFVADCPGHSLSVGDDSPPAVGPLYRAVLKSSSFRHGPSGLLVDFWHGQCPGCGATVWAIKDGS